MYWHTNNEQHGMDPKSCGLGKEYLRRDHNRLEGRTGYVYFYSNPLLKYVPSKERPFCLIFATNC